MLEYKCDDRERNARTREWGGVCKEMSMCDSECKQGEQCLSRSFIVSIKTLTFFHSLQIVPYFGLLFTCFEMCKQLCLYRNGYIVSPLSYKLAPGVDQSLRPYELEEVKRYLKNRKFGSEESSFGNRWWFQRGDSWTPFDLGKKTFLKDWNTSEALWCTPTLYFRPRNFILCWCLLH